METYTPDDLRDEMMDHQQCHLDLVWFGRREIEREMTVIIREKSFWGPYAERRFGDQLTWKTLHCTDLNPNGLYTPL